MVWLNSYSSDEKLQLWDWKEGNEHRILLSNRNNQSYDIKLEIGTSDDYETFVGTVPPYGVLGFWIDQKYAGGKVWVYRDGGLAICIPQVRWYQGDS